MNIKDHFSNEEKLKTKQAQRMRKALKEFFAVVYFLQQFKIFVMTICEIRGVLCPTLFALQFPCTKLVLKDDIFMVDLSE